MTMPADPGPTLTEALADGLEACRHLVEVTVGYRAMLLEQEFSPEAAEEMTVAYHGHLVALAFRPTP